MSIRSGALATSDTARAAVAGANAGRSFSTLYRIYAPRIREMIRHHTGDPDLAEEITQETFLRVYRASVRFETSQAAQKWLGVVAARLCSNALRHRAIARAHADDETRFSTPAWATDPYEAWVRKEPDVLISLAPRYRHLLLLRHVMALRYQEIATIERVSPQAVATLLLRARRQLAAAVGGTGTKSPERAGRPEQSTSGI